VLNLDPHQVKQAETQRQAADGAVTARLPETYQWLLVPEQVKPESPITWQATRLTGGVALAERASKKLRSDDLLVITLGSTVLRKHLDEVPLWRGDHVAVRQLVEDFARYLYLPRLAGPEVLTRPIHEGLKLLQWPTDSFAYAESVDESKGRYRGLRGGQLVTVTPDSQGMVVKAEVARRQFEREAPRVPPEGGSAPPGGHKPVGGITPPDVETVPPKSQPNRYHGTAILDPARVGRDASQIANEVIAHLSALVGAEVRVTLEIEADVPDGVPESVVRIVLENGKTLKLTSQGFETD
jgi:hypothetical protein